MPYPLADLVGPLPDASLPIFCISIFYFPLVPRNRLAKSLIEDNEGRAFFFSRLGSESDSSPSTHRFLQIHKIR